MYVGNNTLFCLPIPDFNRRSVICTCSWMGTTGKCSKVFTGASAPAQGSSFKNHNRVHSLLIHHIMQPELASFLSLCLNSPLYCSIIPAPWGMSWFMLFPVIPRHLAEICTLKAIKWVPQLLSMLSQNLFKAWRIAYWSSCLMRIAKKQSHSSIYTDNILFVHIR